MFRKMQYNQGNIRVDDTKRKSKTTMESMTRGTTQLEVGKLRKRK